MRKFMIFALALAVLLSASTPAWAWRSCNVAVAKVQVKQVVQVQKVVQVKQVVAVEKVRVAAVVTPYVQVSQVYAYAAPYYAAPLVYGGGGQDNLRLDRLERNVEKLVENQQALIQRLTAPPPK